MAHSLYLLHFLHLLLHLFFFQQMLVKSVQAVQVRDFVFIHCQNLSCELHQITRVFSHSYK